jgi:hypothetical protein
MTLFHSSICSEIAELVPETSENFQLKRLIAREDFIKILSDNGSLSTCISQPLHIILLPLVNQNDRLPCNHPMYLEDPVYCTLIQLECDHRFLLSFQNVFRLLSVFIDSLALDVGSWFSLVQVSKTKK